MAKKDKAVIIDLDSTLASTAHRHHLTPNADPKSTWEAFSMACVDDEPIIGVVTLARMLQDAGYLILILTARDDVSKSLTWEWLNKHDIPVNGMKMRRPEELGVSVTQYKIDVLTHVIEEGKIDIVLYIDDYATTVNRVEDELGIPAICVVPNYESTEPSV